ncbi:aldehyde dehydrogenase family protein [Cupriavidus pinatubonensis]|uniref:aldehyde dehydrogenase family protein n=1 Tax=Cupriavidus pinatubonensis TaxID=248026 RepID=UPI00112CFCC1|nr:aldehyde dehydrogenase family protein [Cupriavidus pinatubonensis]TPQ26757.1 aldehyde dehydrogenase [Cupriavidus pinatubonensis]
MQTHAGLLIDGKLVQGNATLDVVNPATGEVFTTVARATEREAAAAIAAAKAAQPAWGSLALEQRRALLLRFADELEANAEDLAASLVLEQGKPLAEARQELQFAQAFVRHIAGLSLPVSVVQDDATHRIELHHKPLGVVAAIAAWNFPVLIAAYKLAPALLMGNTVVLKPAPTTPLAALQMGAILKDIFPAGVVNVITDANDLGSFLTSHPDIAKVSFTGSTATGKKVMASAGPGLKRITLELGGNDAAIVLDDANVDDIAPKIFGSAFYNCGQVCLALKRLYVHASIHNQLCEALAELARQAVVGNGADEGVTIGPLQNAMQYDKAGRFLAAARHDGKILAGGALLNGDGYFVAPTIVRDLHDQSELVAQEQFAPILPVLRYDAIDEAVVRANASPYGLGGSVWSADEDRARAVAQRLQVGTAWVNHHLHFGPHIPLVGAKESGVGVEFGTEGLAEYAQLSVINIARQQAA